MGVYIFTFKKKKKNPFCAVFVDIMVDLDLQILTKAENLVKLPLCFNLKLGRFKQWVYIYLHLKKIFSVLCLLI